MSGFFDRLKRAPVEGSGVDLPADQQASVEDDPEYRELLDDLAGLGRVRVPSGARERTWAQMRAELQGSPAHRRFAAAGGLWSFRRLATAAAGIVLATGVGVAGYLASTEPGPGDGSLVVITDDSGRLVPSTSASSGDATDETSATTAPGPTVRVPGSMSTTPSSLQPPSSWPTPGRTDQPGASDRSPDPGDTQSSDTPSDPGTSPTAPPETWPSTPPTAPPVTPTTAKPATPTTTVPAPTTSATVLTREQRETTARALAMHVAEALLRGDVQGAAQYVSDSGRSGLFLMAGSLQAPYDYRVVSVTTPDSSRAKAVLEVSDRTPDGQGGYAESRPTFVFDVELGATPVITGVYSAGSAQ